MEIIAVYVIVCLVLVFIGGYHGFWRKQTNLMAGAVLIPLWPFVLAAAVCLAPIALAEYCGKALRQMIDRRRE